MKDKKQQIEEMARDIAKRDCCLYDNCPKPIKHNCVSQDPAVMLESSKHYVTIATWLVNANYQKVDENSVVLTKEEYNKLSYGAHAYSLMMRERYEYSIQKREAMAILDEYNKALADIEAKTVRPVVVSNGVVIKEN